MARIYGAILRKRTDQLCQPVYFPFRVKCRNTDPHCTGVQCTCVTMGQRSAVQSCAHSDPSFPQPPSNLLTVYSLLTEGEHACLEGTVLCKKKLHTVYVLQPGAQSADQPLFMD